MEAICSSETSVDFQRTTRRYIPEDCTLHNRLCEIFKSYDSSIVACVFLTAVIFLPSRWSATIRGYLSSRCLATIRRYLPNRCLATIGVIHRQTHTDTASWSHKPILFFQSKGSKLTNIFRDCPSAFLVTGVNGKLQGIYSSYIRKPARTVGNLLSVFARYP
jgi:hypothetical protein